jgi:hypothetical protein
MRNKFAIASLIAEARTLTSQKKKEADDDLDDRPIHVDPFPSAPGRKIGHIRTTRCPIGAIPLKQSANAGSSRTLAQQNTPISCGYLAERNL